MSDVAVLEHAVREEYNRTSPRRLAVLRPIKVVITNYPQGQVEELEAVNNPEDPSAGSRKIPFGRELFIESADFMETPPPKYFRLKPGGEVRLKYAYIIKCDEVVKDDAGNVIELHCTADLESRSGGATSSRKIKGTIHWVSAAHAIDAEVRLYDLTSLFPSPTPMAISIPESNSLGGGRKCETIAKEADPEVRYQFERLSCFARPDSQPGRLVFDPFDYVEGYVGEGVERAMEWISRCRVFPSLVPKLSIRLAKSSTSNRLERITSRGRCRRLRPVEGTLEISRWYSHRFFVKI
jgi:glutaminyl-tRNA synthetase